MQTEALVSIDVNSGRSTREHTIENTAFKTNLEAAEEVARQLRLRDLSGLIVIDFIDMEDRRNIRGVENRLQESLKYDRARIQVGHISNFGLLEMSRQRLRNSVLESSTVPCAHCGGLGFLRSTASVSVHILHALEEALSRDSKRDLIVHTQPERALHLLNHKRSRLHELEERFGVRIIVLSDLPLEVSKSFTVEQGPLATSLDKRGDSRLRGEVTLDTVAPYSVLEEDRDAQSGGESEDCEDDKKGSERRLRRRRPRRRRGGGRGGCSEPQTTDSLVGQEVQNREGESESVDTASLDDPVSSAVHGASKSRSRFRSPGHRRRSRRRQDDSSSEMADNRGKSSLESSGISKSFGIPETSREEGRRRDLVTHDVHVASSEPQVSAAPKRTGWWARARATLTGDMGS
jgi:ribonuclease E